jgi:excisionase family DNA binding protein
MDRLTYSPSEYAKLKGMPRRRVYDLISMGRIPVIRIRRQIRIQVTNHIALSIEDVSRVFGVSWKTVKRMIDDGEIPSISVGKRKRVLLRDLMLFIVNTQRECSQ